MRPCGLHRGLHAPNEPLYVTEDGLEVLVATIQIVPNEGELRTPAGNEHVRNGSTIPVVAKVMPYIAKDVLGKLFLEYSLDVERLSPAECADDHVPGGANIQIPGNDVYTM